MNYDTASFFTVSILSRSLIFSHRQAKRIDVEEFVAVRITFASSDCKCYYTTSVGLNIIDTDGVTGVV